MDGGAIIALVGVVVGIAGLIIGGVVKYLLGRIDRLDTDLGLARKINEELKETNTLLREQNLELRIVARSQAGFFDRLPPREPKTGDG